MTLISNVENLRITLEPNYHCIKVMGSLLYYRTIIN